MSKKDKECEVCGKKAKHEVKILGFNLCKKHYDIKIKQENG